MNQPLNILMVAAENDGIAHCKVGGIGDVIRDIPAALAKQGCRSSVVTPAYGFLHTVNESTKVSSFSFLFAGHTEQADLYRVRPRTEAAGHSVHYVIDHPSFFYPAGDDARHSLYNDDPPDRPFATDATKFACFCAATAAAVGDNQFGPLDVLHLHDWHAALLLLLRKFDSTCKHLQNIRTVYTIHNLALQGIRPFRGDPSSLERWYPHIGQTTLLLEETADPRWPDCINPMAVGIRLADAVHAVSPSYAEEILKPSRPPQFFGGEGLEADLQQANAEGRLHGILNGCEYPENKLPKTEVRPLIKRINAEAVRWAARRTALSFADYTAFQTLEKLETARKKPDFIAVSISRVVDQKMLLLTAPGSDGVSGLEKILQTLGPGGLYILLGNGNREIETFLAETAALHRNFLFLNSYAAGLSDTLYASGSLFLMPSSFEPCGIGQMLAMREGQPCLVHLTGGLRDTVKPGVNGFGFEGETLTEQVDDMAAALGEALRLRRENPTGWEKICAAAAEARFLWTDSAEQYIEKLYTRS
jgi:starch synthase